MGGAATRPATESRSAGAIEWRITGGVGGSVQLRHRLSLRFGSDPTLGYCEGVLTWLIREGNYGEVSLNGLAVVLVIHRRATCSKRTGSSVF